MIGISKEDLKDKLSTLYWSTDDCNQLITAMMCECKELDPWLKVDENTPRDRNLHLYSIAGDEGYRQWIGRIRPDMRCPPSHYKLFPEDPK